MSNIQTPNGLPVDFSKSPEQLANEINQRAEEIARDNPGVSQADIVRGLVDATNAQAREAVEGPAPQQVPDPLHLFIEHFYSLLTIPLRAILSAGIKIRAELAQTSDGTLTIDIHPAERVVRVDEEKKIVYRAKDADPTDGVDCGGPSESKG